MEVIHTIQEFREYRRGLGLHGKTPFVPTMGALHDGHASLVRQAREMAGHGDGDAVLSSIFVNPTQFGPSEDFTKYPRTVGADVEVLKEAGCDAVFVPSAEEMYGKVMNAATQGAAMTVDPGPVGGILEGAIRPGHFRGVCTVVAKLLNIVQPSHLLLGQKDFQQQAVLRQMCRELNMPVEVVTCPTMREGDGLAMSSRNRYLSVEERVRAVGLYEALMFAKEAFGKGEREAERIEAGMEDRLKARGLEVQYALVAEPETLKLWRSGEGMVEGEAVGLIAAKLGTTRLIDNMML